MVAASLYPPTSEDQSLLDALALHHGDLLSFARSQSLSPTQALAWSFEPHIQPWIEALQQLIARRREQQVADALSAAISQLTLILNSALDAPTRLKTTNSLIRLSQSLLKATRPPRPRIRSLSAEAKPERNATAGPAKIAHPSVPSVHVAQRVSADASDSRSPVSFAPAQPPPASAPAVLQSHSHNDRAHSTAQPEERILAHSSRETPNAPERRNANAPSSAQSAPTAPRSRTALPRARVDSGPRAAHLLAAAGAPALMFYRARRLPPPSSSTSTGSPRSSSIVRHAAAAGPPRSENVPPDAL